MHENSPDPHCSYVDFFPSARILRDRARCVYSVGWGRGSSGRAGGEEIFDDREGLAWTGGGASLDPSRDYRGVVAAFLERVADV